MEDEIIEQTDTVETDDGLSDFDSALFDGEPDYQTGNDDQDGGDEDEKDGQEAQDGPETEETPEGENTKEDEKTDDGEPQEPTDDGGEQKFTIKVNKQERSLTLDEMTEYAQKGADYDRVKGQLAESRQAVEQLQQTLASQHDLVEMLELVASLDANKRSPAELVEGLYIRARMGQGMDEAAARASLRADKLQRENEALKEHTAQEEKGQETTEERARREIEEFQQLFPDVPLTEELADSLMPDIQAGMSMANAYRKAQDAQKDAEIARLNRELAAEKQNKKNKKASVGSQSDSGGRRGRSDIDDFNAALFG